MKVYLIEEPDTGLVKVGVSDVPYRRVAYLQAGRPKQIFLRYEYDAVQQSDAYRIERDTHIILAAVREEGEWFRCSLEEARAALDAAVAEPLERQYRRQGLKVQVNLRLTEEEFALLNDLAATYGGQNKAVVAGLKLLADPKELPKDVIVSILRRRIE